MHRIDHPAAASSLPQPFAVGVPGYFKEGSVAAGDPPTEVSADWLNAVQEEIVGAILAAGLALSKQDNGQLAGAIPLLAIPAGATVEIAGATAPDGWGLCDGGIDSRTGQARLYARIGTSFGAGDGSTTFNRPARTAAAGYVYIIKY
ncbi:MAG: tail fiber protein [Pseudomonas sp.]|nr:tail fiber protein [Pseudomonas sp.]